ncbi:hypothetical protein HOE67_01000 [Candidatus Peregrinibacteria bacterium]|jgi:hypothetical protein|nr:hypothetical protein [Candidatus Peregrinibacteria bacterium]MBT4055665.1 hypothetical protein [Candidatus Peregrinibacteria bacterium]
MADNEGDLDVSEVYGLALVQGAVLAEENDRAYSPQERLVCALRDYIGAQKNVINEENDGDVGGGIERRVDFAYRSIVELMGEALPEGFVSIEDAFPVRDGADPSPTPVSGGVEAKKKVLFAAAVFSGAAQPELLTVSYRSGVEAVLAEVITKEM